MCFLRVPRLPLLLCILAALFVTGCGGSATSTAPPVVSPTVRPNVAPATPLVVTSTTPAAVPSVASGATGAMPSPAPGATMMAQAPIAPEQNPTGDIPDTQTFVTYISSNGYTLEVPEGWARSTQAAQVAFTDKYNAVVVDLMNASAAPTVADARTTIVPKLTGGAIAVQKIGQMMLPGGPAVQIAYTANSAPNAVTGKQVRLENESYVFFKNGKQAILTVWAPQGADNVDQWQRIAQSFRWTT